LKEAGSPSLSAWQHGAWHNTNDDDLQMQQQQQQQQQQQ